MSPGLIIYLQAADYTSNLLELVIRAGSGAFNLRSHITLILVAMLRMLMVWIGVFLLDKYGYALVRKKQLEYYEQTSMLVAQLSAEAVCMKKNMEQVEVVDV